VAGWIGFFFLAYKVTLIEVEHKEYDPFAILGIDRVRSFSFFFYENSNDIRTSQLYM
jgi:hypothetical protein